MHKIGDIKIIDWHTSVKPETRLVSTITGEISTNKKGNIFLVKQINAIKDKSNSIKNYQWE